MSYTGYDRLSSSHSHSRYDTYHTTPRHDGTHLRDERRSAADVSTKLAAMHYSEDDRSYHYPPSPSSYTSHDPRRSAAYPGPRTYSHKSTWPPSPSVEDETESLSKEALSSLSRDPKDSSAEGEPPASTRGAVDQESLLDDIEPPALVPGYDDRRFVLLSEPTNEEDDKEQGKKKRQFRVRTENRDRFEKDSRPRKHMAERGHTTPIKTTVEGDREPPVFTGRVSTPYAYTKSQKESTAPSPSEFLRSPDMPIPAVNSSPQSATTRHTWTSDGDRVMRPTGAEPSHSRHESYSKIHDSVKTDVFEDSGTNINQSTPLPAENKSTPYSFVKSDLQREDLRMNLRDNQERPMSRRTSRHRSPPSLHRGNSSTSSKDYHFSQSPSSSSSSLQNVSGQVRPSSVDIEVTNRTRTQPRPSSPLTHQEPSPRLPPRPRESPPYSRPSSRGNTRPASPLSFPTTVRPPSSHLESITDADWYSTYPPPVQSDRSRPSSRFGRHETMPEPAPRIDVHSPSPARQPQYQSSLPYPVDDAHIEAFMPPEQLYQFDHSTVNSPQQMHPDSPRTSSPSIPVSPGFRKERTYDAQTTPTNLDQPPHSGRNRTSSIRSTNSNSSLRENPGDMLTPGSLRRPLPTCPRSMRSSRYDEWYTLRGFPNFDICPTCFEGVFAETNFVSDFALRKREETPRDRYCHFSSPWFRLAWLRTVQQRRRTLNLLYRLVDVTEKEEPCPENRELGIDRITWYGIPEQRDGIQVSTFAICACDKKRIEVLFPSIQGYFIKISPQCRSLSADKYICSLRTSSRRFPKYLDLLAEIDADAQFHDIDRPSMKRFVQMARDCAFKNECARGKILHRKPWHFIPRLPEFTVCEECFDEVVWPAVMSKSSRDTIPRMMNKTIQLVPHEDNETGSSCCLWSSRMRRVWDNAVRNNDFKYLERKALERKRAQDRITREKNELSGWKAEVERGGVTWNRCEERIRMLEREWKEWNNSRLGLEG